MSREARKKAVSVFTGTALDQRVVFKTSTPIHATKFTRKATALKKLTWDASVIDGEADRLEVSESESDDSMPVARDQPLDLRGSSVTSTPPPSPLETGETAFFSAENGNNAIGTAFFSVQDVSSGTDDCPARKNERPPPIQPKKVDVDEPFKVLAGVREKARQRPYKDLVKHEIFSPQALSDYQQKCIKQVFFRERYEEGPHGGIFEDMDEISAIFITLSGIKNTKIQKRPSKATEKGELISSLGTLVVLNSKDQCKAWVRDAVQISKELKVQTFPGTSSAEDLAKNNLVCSDFKTLVKACGPKRLQSCPLLGINWHRLLVGRGHGLTDHSTVTDQAKYVRLIKATHRYVVAEKPEDAYVPANLLAFVQFMQIQPLSEQAFWDKTIGKEVEDGTGEAKRLKLLTDGLVV